MHNQSDSLPSPSISKGLAEEKPHLQQLVTGFASDFNTRALRGTSEELLELWPLPTSAHDQMVSPGDAYIKWDHAGAAASPAT